MGHDERDEKFERGLARHLRLEAGRRRVACPDAEMLAALHERSPWLSTAEWKVAQEHVAACSRCQEILAQLAATDEVVLDSQTSAGAQSAEVLRAPSDISRGRKKARWQWVAPAGALAAGLLIWVVAHEQWQDVLRPTDKIQIAEKRSEERAYAPSRSASRSDELATIEQNKQKPLDGFDARAEADTKSGEYQDKSLSAAAAPKPARRAEKTDEIAAAGAPANAADQRMGKQTANLPAIGRNDLSKEKLETNAKSAAAVSSAQPSAPPAESAGDKASAQAVQAKAAPSNTNAAPNKKEAAAAGALREQVEMTGAEASNPHEISSPKDKSTVIAAPGDAVLWRVGRAGSVERSVDSGATWLRQSSGVSADLLGGSAPSDTVCWIIGGGGVILRTADGGEHWAKLRSPVVEERNIEIRATDEMHATVFGGGKGARFTTRDGGVTWTVMDER